MQLNREGWLTNLAEMMVPRLEDITGTKMPNFRISMSFPTKNALARHKRVVGQCWDKVVCQDGSHQLFITPLVSDELNVGEIVAHEMCHAIVGVKHGHKKPFVNVIRPLGLVGKATATEPGPVFIEYVTPLLEKLGPYPHGGMTINPKYKAEKGRMVKATCPACDYKVRITRVWLDQENYGPPICPSHMMQMIEE